GRGLRRPAPGRRRARHADPVRRHVPRFPPHDKVPRQGARRRRRGGGLAAEGIRVRRQAGPAAVRRTLLCAIVVAVAGGGGGRAASADVLVPNRTYAAGTALEAPSLGVAFVMPAGWAGKFAEDAKSHVVVMGSNTIEGVGLAVLQSGQSPAQVVAALREPQNLGAGVVLRPMAEPSVQGSRVTARFQDNTYVGRALAVLGPAGQSVIFFF